MVITKWRPAASIKVKAIGLHWREGKLLAVEVLDDQGRLKGVRPLGGSIEFGETWHSALIREFKEELNVDVQIMGSPLVMENLYTHEGVLGHEVLFIGEVLFDIEILRTGAGLNFKKTAQCNALQDGLIWLSSTCLRGPRFSLWGSRALFKKSMIANQELPPGGQVLHSL